MSFLLALINNENDAILREDLQDRVDIVTHKIKFMDKVPVICLNSKNEIQDTLHQIIGLAGGQMVADAAQAKVVIYIDPQKSIANLIGNLPSLIATDWPAATYNHIYVVDDTEGKNAATWISMLEDIAEMLHPGSFVFGNEGKRWINFSAQL